MFTGGYRSIGRDAGHGHGVCRRLITVTGSQGGITSDVRSAHLLDDGAIDNVVDEVLGDASLLGYSTSDIKT